MRTIDTRYMLTVGGVDLEKANYIALTAQEVAKKANKRILH